MRRFSLLIALVPLALTLAAAPASGQHDLRLGLSAGPDAPAALAARVRLGPAAALRATLFHARATDRYGVGHPSRLADAFVDVGHGPSAERRYRTGGSLALLHAEPASGRLRAHAGVVVTAHRTVERADAPGYAYHSMLRAGQPFAYRRDVIDLARLGVALGLEARLARRVYLHAEGEVGLEKVWTSQPGSISIPRPPGAPGFHPATGPRETTTRLDALIPGVSVGVAYRIR